MAVDGQADQEVHGGMEQSVLGEGSPHPFFLVILKSVTTESQNMAIPRLGFDLREPAVGELEENQASSGIE